jgi:hypothetical protein
MDRRNDTPHRRSASTRARLPRVVLLAACLLVASAALGACSSPAASAGVTAMRGEAVAAVGGSTAGNDSVAGGVSDWTHMLEVLALLKADPPVKPVVVLLGGSAARESTVSDTGQGSWADQVAAAGGPSVLTYNLGSREQTLAQDLQIVKLLPEGTLVFIGMNIGRFVRSPSSPKITLPITVSLSPHVQHQYTVSNTHTNASKRIMLHGWLVERYPLFKRNYAYNARLLTTLVKACKERGLHPVLLDQPRNLAIIRPALDAPVKRMTATCRSVARAQGIPWVSFVAKANIPSSSFFDLWHMVEPGRITWQGLLSAKTKALLIKYGLGGGA